MKFAIIKSVEKEGKIVISEGWGKNEEWTKWGDNKIWSFFLKRWTYSKIASGFIANIYEYTENHEMYALNVCFNSCYMNYISIKLI